MQLSGIILKGAHCSMMGSELIFVEDHKNVTGIKGVEDITKLEMDDTKGIQPGSLQFPALK